MNYYYNIDLNFLKGNCKFYNWLETDCILNIKKIPIFLINDDTFTEIYLNDIIVDNFFLKTIENKTLTKNSKINYCCLMVCKKKVCALRFNRAGFIIYRSSLKLLDELNILEYINTLKKIKIKYKVLNKCKFYNDIRYITYVNEKIQEEIDQLYEENNFNKLKYLYLEWFNKDQNNIETMYNDMKNNLNNKIDDDKLKIFSLIKLSYKNV